MFILARFVNINEIVEQVKERRFNFAGVIDRITFKKVFLYWVLYMFSFGVIFFLLSFTQNDGVLYKQERLSPTISGFVTAQYFSFITSASASQGYGDVMPHGISRIFAVIEAVSGLIIFGLLISKLVSKKQDMILNELYELSFNEKINRLRSSLLLFRQNLSRVITKIEDGSIKKREVSEMYMYLSSLEDTLNETTTLTQRSNGNSFIKTIDPLNTELLLNSILSSFEKLNELITIFNQNKLEWHREITLMLIDKCMRMNENLFARINSSKSIQEKIIGELNLRKKNIMAAIKSALEPSPAVEVKVIQG